MPEQDDLEIPAHLRRTPDVPLPVVGSASLAPPPPPPPAPVATPAAPTHAGVPVGVDVAKRTAQYVKLRDKIKELQEKHAEELKPYQEAKASLDILLLDVLSRSNTKSMRTEEGTISALDKVTCSVEDGEVFREHVTTNQDWDIVDFRANSKAVEAYLEVNQTLPPGVKMSTFRALGVRRA